MSFAALTKKELTLLETESCCEKAELSALIRMNGTISLSNRRVVLDISTENAAISRRIYTLLKRHFKVVTELLVRKKMRLKKNNVYVVRVPVGAETILNDLSIVSEGFLFHPSIDKELVRKSCCKKAYLRGAFLAGGRSTIPRVPLTIWKSHRCTRSIAKRS